MKPKSTLRRLFGYLSRYSAGYIVGSLAEVGTQVGLQLMMAYLLRGLTDAAVGKDFGLLLNVALVCSALSVVALFVLPWGIRKRTVAGEQAAVDLRQELFDKINRLPAERLEQLHSGELVSRLTNDVTAAKDAYGNILIQVVTTMVTAVACAIYVLTISWKLALAAFAAGLVPFFFNRWVAPRLRKVSGEVQQSLASLNAKLKDLLAGVPVIRAFRAEQRFVQEYSDANHQALHLGYRRAWLQSGVNAGNDFLGGFGMITMLVLASYFIMTRELSPGAAVATVQVMHNVLRPFQVLGDLWARLQQSLAGSDRIFALLDEAGENLPEPEGPINLGNGAALRLTDVRFNYGDKKVLSGVSLEVPKGKVIALAGPSGGGKSTLFKLLLGFHPATKGTIAVHGRDINSYSLDELRELIAFVPQDSYLYAGTVRENISYGNSEASREEVVAAAKAANAHDFIMQLPDGYDTYIGERGAQLSGGQRQRISIARAILKDAPILLLDEATSSLDSESEALVQQALNRLMQGRTTLIIAHRLSTIRSADCIHVVAGGEVVESGTHEELLQLDGIYKQLHEMQDKAA